MRIIAVAVLFLLPQLLLGASGPVPQQGGICYYGGGFGGGGGFVNHPGGGPSFGGYYPGQIRPHNMPKPVPIPEPKVEPPKKVPLAPIELTPEQLAYSKEQSIKGIKAHDQSLINFYQSDRYQWIRTNEDLSFQYKQLSDLNPKESYQRTSKNLGLRATESAFQANDQCDEQATHFYKDLGKDFLDLASGLNPVTGSARSAYEFFSGKDLFTGLELTSLERGFAFAGIIGGGLPKNLSKVATLAKKLIQKSPEIFRNIQRLEKTIETGETIASSPKEELLLPPSQAPPIQDSPTYRFYRIESPTQDPNTANLIEESGMVWGTTPKNGGDFKSVQGYYGELPPGVKGQQFETPIKPTSINGNGSDPQGAMVYWTEGTPGVKALPGDEFVAIPVTVIKNTQGAL